MAETNQKYCIYFIAETPFSARVKMGKAKNITNKLHALQAGNPNKLMIYRKVDISDPTLVNAVEHFLRNLLSGERTSLLREECDWFALELHKVDEICDLLEMLLKAVERPVAVVQSRDKSARAPNEKAGLTQKVSFAGQQIVINLARELPPTDCKLL